MQMWTLFYIVLETTKLRFGGGSGEGDLGISVGDIKHPQWALFGSLFGPFLGVLHGYVLFAACVPHHKNK
jgi:hypothetical protein